jgi:UDP-2,3-diacylglucosamine pyrophosphatase LpxH
MPLFCISDLHFGDRGPRDNFAYGNREERLNTFLDFVGINNGQLLILGDLFDFWQVNLSSAVNAYRELICRLAAMHATYVLGNHDNAFVGFVGTRFMPDHVLFRRSQTAFETRIGDRRFAFLHGHETDPYCRSLNPGTGEITAIISGMLEDRNRGPFHDRQAVEDEFVCTLESALTLCGAN